MDVGLQDTIACRVVDEFLQHIYNPDFVMEDSDYINILRNFWKLSGSWEKLLFGDIDHVRKLEGVLDVFVSDKILLQGTR